MKKSRVNVISLLGILFIHGFTANDTFAQRDRNEEIKLIKDASKNGYKLSKRRGKFFVQMNNVFDPISKKLVEGLHDLSYRCGSGNELTRIKLKLSRGNTQRVAIACALIMEPKIIILDEPDSS